VGVFPVRKHYYEPLFDARILKHPLDEVRQLPGIDWNVSEQLQLLSCFHFEEELNNIPFNNPHKMEFYLNNLNFGPGDAEYWYNIVRHFKPKRIIEIGSGYSTLMAQKAINKNRESSSVCQHICIEPYEMPWLEYAGVQVIRRKLEDIDRALFGSLNENDILFIDSSHVIRPQGDVLVEFLELLPRLQRGVIVHVHDIFSPHDYPAEWIRGRVRLWNEQYLLEAFLTFNNSYKIIGALSFLHEFAYDALKSKCPFLSTESNPGSFYMKKTV
jgi:hypothetical protein